GKGDGSGGGQSQLGAQAALGRVAEGEGAAVEVSEVCDDRETEARPRLALVEALAPVDGLLSELRCEARTVVVDDDKQQGGFACLCLRDGNLEENLGLRPLAGIVQEIAEQFLEILLLALDARVRRTVQGNVHLPLLVDAGQGTR